MDLASSWLSPRAKGDVEHIAGTYWVNICWKEVTTELVSVVKHSTMHCIWVMGSDWRHQCMQSPGENVLNGTGLAVMWRAGWGHLKHGDSRDEEDRYIFGFDDQLYLEMRRGKKSIQKLGPADLRNKNKLRKVSWVAEEAHDVKSVTCHGDHET